ncbi:cytochrome d ubiquinol oxidase subunit II [Mycolicibacterium celeriflavum]|uniref:Cytochrome D ubiquinol oxidase subunit II n=1 Tax=Mycolicibacterium celeriflavum TaxID=1249101 RepID=A0A1X0BQI9_MYCCF|nr:cytochrome d ubiquinol oxidase subunit II [Mycolicibacterium celeriflavum]MCV7240002.1 cytochrome d ubiquinol oxidase subunit II [Mycolicibacterium celeriflavum]OBG20862.1 cytochrome d ubiquinol oxidase subunit II [Mycolicibacterium celeriflavum]ORA45417.1 cytochrome d ubiquinol oxidase subunit II [Mycolicibacterium celeriflavum]BBY42708.1 cytochrome D ubiquinol oxidase subunit II [Mycolicibacterium celeriflavum]
MALQDWWFVVMAGLFLGFFVLEGFDFGVGMLMGLFGRAASDDPERHRRAALNTIGPVWDGNEVWLITAGGAMFAAFPDWYATMFSGLYLPLLAILVSMILRVVAIEWRGKIDDADWRRWADVGIAVGSWVPAVLWGVAFAALVRGLPVDADKRMHAGILDLLNGYTLLGGLATAGLFLWHGAVFVALKTDGAVKDDALRFAHRLALPVTAVLAAFGLWTQLAHGKSWTWIVLLVAGSAQLVAVDRVWRRSGEGWAFACTTVVVAALVVLFFGTMYPNLVPSTIDPAFSLTVDNASSSPYTLTIMSWAALVFAPLVLLYQGWTYWVFRQRISAEEIPASAGLTRRLP